MTKGSGSGRPKIIWILRIRIRILQNLWVVDIRISLVWKGRRVERREKEVR
jgi:hypothetical protein